MAQIHEFERYAIFQTGGKQYQALEGKTLSVEKLQGNPGDTIEFTDVYFRKIGPNQFEIGKPTLTGAVKASIIKEIKDPKIIVYKFKRRTKGRVKKGHRQPKTVIRITSIGA